MNVLFIFWGSPGTKDNHTLAHDLAMEFGRQKHNVTVAIPVEKRFNQLTRLVKEEFYEALYVKSSNFFNLKNKFKKAFSAYVIPKSILRAIMVNLSTHKFDLIITRAPFLASTRLIIPLKKHFKCNAHLLLFDMFPFTARDMGMIKNNLVFNFLKYKEERTMAEFSTVWCTSPGTADYLLKQYPNLPVNKVKWLYHYAVIKPVPQIDKLFIKKSFGYLNNDFIVFFGGNFGPLQKLENVLSLAKYASVIKPIKFLFVGSGSEKERISKLASDMQLSNVKFMDYIERNDYEHLATSCDIGLVSLDECLTLPNFPSKTIDYFKVGLPVLASLDRASYADYGKILEENNAGLCSLAGNLDELLNNLKKLYYDPTLRQTMGRNGRKFYEKEFDVSNACKKIVQRYSLDKCP